MYIVLLMYRYMYVLVKIHSEQHLFLLLRLDTQSNSVCFQMKNIINQVLHTFFPAVCHGSLTADTSNRVKQDLPQEVRAECTEETFLTYSDFHVCVDVLQGLFM